MADASGGPDTPIDKSASERALDALSFCNAGIQTGLGPFIAIFYGTVRHWNPSQIGILLALQSLAGMTVQTFVGHAVDVTRRKRLITAVSAILIAIGALGIALAKSFAVQAMVQVVVGIGVTVFPAATCAFAMGICQHHLIARRFARNEVCTHSGNVVFAITAAIIGTFLTLQGVFYAAAVFAAGMAVAVWFMRADHIDHEAARAGTKGKEKASFRDLVGDRRILTFTAGVVLFVMANSATLPLVGQLFARAENAERNVTWQTALAVITAEAVMVGIAALVGRKADSWGRKPIMLVAFALLAIRDGLGVASHAPAFLIALQVLDGAAAASYGVLLKLVTSDLAKGTGRFNALTGAVQTSMAIGAFSSNLLFGYIARRFSINTSFVGLALVGVIGGLFYAWRMPETRPESPQAT